MRQFLRLSPFLVFAFAAACGTSSEPDAGGTGTKAGVEEAGGKPQPPSAANDAGPSAPSDASVPVDTALEKQIKDQMEVAKIPGLQVAIVKGETIVFRGAYGSANLADKAPVTNDTVFRLASVSKTVTATALMKLYEEGKFKLDDDVSPALGFSLRSPSFPTTPITYRMLLTHTSTIHDEGFDLPDSLFPDDRDSDATLEGFVQDCFKPGGKYYAPDKTFDPGKHAPGTNWEYSNFAITLVGYLVQKLASKPFDLVTLERIFQPLGMTDLSWHTNGFTAKGGMATPYAWSASGGHDPHGQFGYPDWPAGSLRMSASTLARFMAMFIGGGQIGGQLGGGVRILEAATVNEMKRVQYPAVDPGQGLVVYYLDNPKGTYPKGTFPRVGHNGGEPEGVSTEMYWEDGNPPGLGIVILANTSIGDDDGQGGPGPRSKALDTIRDALQAHSHTL